MRLGITPSDRRFVQRLELTNRAWTYIDLAANLSANSSEKVREYYQSSLDYPGN
jgi:hypothetical protein